MQHFVVKDKATSFMGAMRRESIDSAAHGSHHGWRF
jgi:hypothetical protein